MVEEVKLVLKESFPFLEPEILRDFCNLRILSNDGHHFYLNKCVFAANCKPFATLVRETEDLAITTDLSKEELGRVINFCVSGTIPGYRDLEDANILETFQQFGIHLKDLKIGVEAIYNEVSEVKNGRHSLSRGGKLEINSRIAQDSS